MYKRTVGVFGALALGVSMLVGALIVPAASAATTRIVGNPATCPGATYPTINAAVAVADPGDTIKVCAGTYTENVLVTKPLDVPGRASRQRRPLPQQPVAGVGGKQLRG
jgi:nitrous oxidase accessory protein NosD